MSISAGNTRRLGAGDPGELDQRRRDPARLEAVERTGLLDSPIEESFDALTRLAARLLRVPASFISILDGERDFYKSQVGFAPPLALARQLSGRTFCHYTLASDDVLVIGDTHSDPLWKTVPTVHTIGVRAYVGVPLKVGDETIGSFCIMDTEPRAWQEDELETLQQLAVSAAREISLRAALAAVRADAVHVRAMARAREEVTAVLAHDLRTPLQTIQLSTALLQRNPGAGQPAVVARMVTAVSAIKDMVDGLLSSSAVLAPLAAKMTPILAVTVLQDAVDMMAPIAERSGIALTLGAVAPATITVDYSLMLRVLGNLAGNAIKYSPAGSTVVIGATRNGGSLAVTVADSGRGMNPEEVDHAFDSGWQGAEGMARGDGAGLGLAIVKKLVQDHGGRVRIDSRVGRGTTLTVDLPCDPADDGSAGPPAIR